jgi:cell division protein FtsW
LMGIGIGALAFLIARIVPASIIRSCTQPIFWTALVITALTIYSPFKIHIHGSSRWLNCAGLIFQPSELLKMAFILYLAYFFSTQQRYTTWHTYIPLIIVCGTTSAILLQQPDFGLTMTLLSTTLILFFITQSGLAYIASVCAALGVSATILILMQPYRMQRIAVFLDPWKDPKGKGFQIIQSLIAIGSGGTYGLGISHSRQKFFYVPMQHTDFIFSIIAEETGFLGSCIIVLLFTIFVYYGIKLALQLHNQYAAFCVLGFTILIGLQSIINIAVASNLAPTKGIGLPFISYGNTSLVCTLCMIGFIVNLVHQELR